MKLKQVMFCLAFSMLVFANAEARYGSYGSSYSSTARMSTTSTMMRSSSTARVATMNSNNAMNMVTTMAVLTILTTDSNGNVVEKKVNPEVLTVCSTNQYSEAVRWQESCENGKGVANTGYCPLMSYQRFCEPATPDDVKGLQPIKGDYRNTYRNREWTDLFSK